MRVVVTVVLLAAAAFAQSAAIDPAAATRAVAVAAIRTEPKVAWEVKPRYRDASAFAFADGVLVTGNTSGQGGTYAYDATSGKQMWTVPGHIRGGPAIAGGAVYAVNDTKDRYRFALRKLDLRTGKAAWSVAEEDMGNHDGPPVVIDAQVVVVSRSGSVAAFDSGTGAPLWRHDKLKVCVGQLSAADGLVYVSGGLSGSSDTLTALDAATGKTAWRVAVTSAGAKGCGSGTAVAGGVVVTGMDRDVIAYDARTGERKWTRMVAPTVAGRRQDVALAQIVVAEGVVYAATPTAIIGSDLSSGRALVELPLPVTAELSTMALMAAGDVLYLHANSALPGGSRGPAMLYALDIAERRVMWSYAVARPDQYDEVGSWPTRFMLPAEGALFYENQQLLVKLVP